MQVSRHLDIWFVLFESKQQMLLNTGTSGVCSLHSEKKEENEEKLPVFVN